MANLTLHVQRVREVTLAEAGGFALESEPRGIEVPLGVEAFQKAAGQLTELLGECAARDAAVLAGGHTGLWIGAICRFLRDGAELPAIYVFGTRRVRNREGRYVFVPEGLLRVEEWGSGRA